MIALYWGMLFWAGLLFLLVIFVGLPSLCSVRGNNNSGLVRDLMVGRDNMIRPTSEETISGAGDPATNTETVSNEIVITATIEKSGEEAIFPAIHPSPPKPVAGSSKKGNMETLSAENLAQTYGSVSQRSSFSEPDIRIARRTSETSASPESRTSRQGYIEEQQSENPSSASSIHYESEIPERERKKSKSESAPALSTRSNTCKYILSDTVTSYSSASSVGSTTESELLREDVVQVHNVAEAEPSSGQNDTPNRTNKNKRKVGYTPKKRQQ